jgi:hypothetical protein
MLLRWVVFLRDDELIDVGRDNVNIDPTTPRGTPQPIAFPPTPPGAAASTFSVFPTTPTNPFGSLASPRVFGKGISMLISSLSIAVFPNLLLLLLLFLL